MNFNSSGNGSRRPYHADNDFSSILYESKWDKAKPAIKVFTVIVLICAVGYSALWFASKKNVQSEIMPANGGSSASKIDDSALKLSQCIVDMGDKNPTPDTSDTSFYQKLIAGYDAKLSCYDKYPTAGTSGRSSIEYARESALNASGDYKSAYMASTSGASITYKNNTTGCDYSLSESEYLKCSDAYYAAHPSTASSGKATATNPATTPTYSAPSQQQYTNNTNSTSNTSNSTAETDKAYWMNKCQEDVARQYAGATQTIRDKALEQCYTQHGI